MFVFLSVIASSLAGILPYATTYNAHTINHAIAAPIGPAAFAAPIAAVPLHTHAPFIAPAASFPAVPAAVPFPAPAPVPAAIPPFRFSPFAFGYPYSYSYPYFYWTLANCRTNWDLDFRSSDILILNKVTYIYIHIWSEYEQSTLLYFFDCNEINEISHVIVVIQRIHFQCTNNEKWEFGSIELVSRLFDWIFSQFMTMGNPITSHGVGCQPLFTHKMLGIRWIHRDFVSISIKAKWNDRKKMSLWT